MAEAIFFVSTGRTGTKWLSRAFHELYEEECKVVHEPVSFKKGLGPSYLKSIEDPQVCVENMPNLASHVSKIKEIIKTRNYVWCGWDCYAIIPYVIRALGDASVKIVHLQREKETALDSLVKSAFYGKHNFHMKVHPSPIHTESINPLPENFEGLELREFKEWYYNEIRDYSQLLRSTYKKVRSTHFWIDRVFNHEKESMKELIRFMELPWKEEFYNRSFEKEDSWACPGEGADGQ